MKETPAAAAAAELAGLKVTEPSLPSFDERKDDSEAYVHRSEVLEELVKRPIENWALILSSHLVCIALEVYFRLFPVAAPNYELVKMALMKRSKCTEESFLVRFKNIRPERNELISQFVKKLLNLLNKLLDLQV